MKQENRYSHDWIAPTLVFLFPFVFLGGIGFLIGEWVGLGVGLVIGLLLVIELVASSPG